MIFDLENDLISIKVNTLGAELISLQTKENNLEYIWEADPEVWARHAPVLFPIVGKLKNDTYFFNGKTYSLPQHGFVRDKVFKLLDKEQQFISFKLISDHDTLKNYPFPFEFITTYSLEESKVIVKHQIINPVDSEMYFSIGAHPGFRCPLGAENFEDYFLEFEVEESFSRYKIKESLISGEQEIVRSHGNIIPLKRELFKEDALVFKNLKSKYVSLKNKVNNHYVKVTLEDFPFLGIWTKLMVKATFVCIEPWLGIADNYETDGNFKQKEGIIRLNGYQHFDCNYSIVVH